MPSKPFLVLTSLIGMGAIQIITRHLVEFGKHVFSMFWMKCGIASSRMVYINMLIHITIIVTCMQTSNVRRIVAERKRHRAMMRGVRKERKRREN